MKNESPEARERRLLRARQWKQKHAKKHAESVARYRLNYPEKKRATSAVSYALRVGRLVKQNCQTCGASEDICAHHEDYSKPLDVTWLCRSCHVKHHEPHLYRGPRPRNASVCKLTEDDVRRIRQLLASNLLKNSEIALMFGVTKENISSIREGKTWTHIQDGLSIAKRNPRNFVSAEISARARQLLADGYTQASISREMNLSTATISRILHGRK